MTGEPFLLRLAAQLAEGAARFDANRAERHAAFLRSRRLPDGGYPGREGDSDLYYTSFAVRGLALLGALNEDDCASLAGYLRAHDWRTLGVIDLMNWLWLALALQAAGGINVLADAPDDFAATTAARLEAVRTADGGYARSTAGAVGSTYQTFLTVLTYQLLGRNAPRPGALVQFLYDRRRDDGGFVEIAPMRRSGTNPTAAAAVLLKVHGALDEDIISGVRDFLREVRSDEGGFQANTRVPFADSLSTFTALLTQLELGIPPVIPNAAIRKFIEGALEFPTGGFRAANWDNAADVEYTFYGLATLALLDAS